MFLIEADNVNDAYVTARQMIMREGKIQDSRNGKVLRFPRPVMTNYKFPQERVLFDAKRDANPFFHLFEALWMLGGRNDIAFLEQFNSTIGQFSDNGKTLHGAYGHRWRTHFGVDQLDQLILDLFEDKTTRRAVLGMWDPYIDGPVARAGGKDVPCNTHVYFSVKPYIGDSMGDVNFAHQLDMTVCNRSNDLIWGAYGANVVHMSVLHEYVALSVGLQMGDYYQMSNDLHVYEKHFHLLDVKPEDMEMSDFYQVKAGDGFQPLFDYGDKREFDKDVLTFLDDPFKVQAWRTSFFAQTVSPMARAWKMYKAKFHASALELASQVEGQDWRKAAIEWLERRPTKVVQL